MSDEDKAGDNQVQQECPCRGMLSAWVFGVWLLFLAAMVVVRWVGY